MHYSPWGPKESDRTEWLFLLPLSSSCGSSGHHWEIPTRTTREEQPAWKEVDSVLELAFCEELLLHRRPYNPPFSVAGSSWQQKCWVKVTAVWILTWFTLISWGPCDCLPAGLFIWKAQKNEPRTAAQGMCPKSGVVEKREGIKKANSRTRLEFQLRQDMPEAEETHVPAFRCTAPVKAFSAISLLSRSVVCNSLRPCGL